VKYVKRNFVPGRQFRDLEDFNAQLAAWQLEVSDLRIHGTIHQRPIDRFAEDEFEGSAFEYAVESSPRRRGRRARP